MNMECFTIATILPYAGLACLFVASEFLGLSSSVEANSIAHFLYLVIKSKRAKPSESFSEAIHDAIIDEFREGLIVVGERDDQVTTAK